MIGIVAWFLFGGVVSFLLTHVYAEVLLRAAKCRSSLARVFLSTLVWLTFALALVSPMYAVLYWFVDRAGPNDREVATVVVAGLFICSSAPTIWRLRTRVGELRKSGYRI